MNKLYSTKCYNPYFNDKNGKKVNQVKIFNEYGVLASVKWFSGKFGSNNRYPEILLPTELKVKRSEDFKSKFCFLFDESVYIPASLVNYQIEPEELDFESEWGYHYKSYFSIDIVCKSYELQLDEFEQPFYLESELKLQTIRQDFNHKTVDKPDYTYFKEISDILKTEGINISGYDLLKISKKYTIEAK
jgi:hypothetical protein